MRQQRGVPGLAEVRKVYRALQDREAAARGFVRVVDESGEDYLYPEGLFVAIELPREAAEAVLAMSGGIARQVPCGGASMIARLYFLALAFSVLIGEVICEDHTKQDMEKLQGKWKVISSEFEGRPATAAYRPGTLIVIERDELYFTDGFAKSARSKYKLDASKSPKAIDLGDDKKALPGIYSLDGDTLKLCLNLEGKRPKDFSPKAADKTNLLILTRQKE